MRSADPSSLLALFLPSTRLHHIQPIPVATRDGAFALQPVQTFPPSLAAFASQRRLIKTISSSPALCLRSRGEGTEDPGVAGLQETSGQIKNLVPNRTEVRNGSFPPSFCARVPPPTPPPTTAHFPASFIAYCWLQKPFFTVTHLPSRESERERESDPFARTTRSQSKPNPPFSFLAVQPFAGIQEREGQEESWESRFKFKTAV